MTGYDVEGRNAAARKRAEQSGCDTYLHEVLEAWRGCTACGEPIRNTAVASRYRVCGCPDVTWHCSVNGWEKVAP